MVYDPIDIFPYGRFLIVNSDVKVMFRERECSTCLYFDRTLFDGFDAEAGPGYCRRYPPALYGSERKPIKQSQPVVSPWEWCGEWEKA